MAVRVSERFKTISNDLKDHLPAIAKKLRPMLAETVRQRLKHGVNGLLYSTQPSLYSITQIYGKRTRFRAYARNNPQAELGPPWGMTIFLPHGYAEYRAVIKSIGIRRRPVTFNLTGALVRDLRGRVRTNKKRGRITAWLGFKRQRRSYGKLTNLELAEILNAYAAPNPALSFTEKDVDRMSDMAINMVMKELNQSL